MELKLSEELRAKLKQYASTAETTDELLAQLEKSELLSPDFPRRSGMSHAEVAGDAAAYRRANTADAAPGSILAVGAIATHAIEALGKARHEPAVPLLIRLWSTCPIEGGWRAAGAALLAVGAPPAPVALCAHPRGDDPDG